MIALMVSAQPSSAQQAVATEIEGISINRTDLSRKDQWHNLKRWVSMTFDRSNVIDMEDAERGTMIIKWSCPVQLPSDFVSAIVQQTYVIDVRDGKYRLQKVNPRVSYQFSRPDLYEDYDASRANMAANDIKIINSAAKRLFDSTYDWPVNDQYEQLAADYLSIASGTPQYRNDRDRERGKVNEDWIRAEHNWKLVAKPLLTLRQLDATMTASLDNALKTYDDF